MMIDVEKIMIGAHMKGITLRIMTGKETKEDFRTVSVPGVEETRIPQ